MGALSDALEVIASHVPFRSDETRREVAAHVDKVRELEDAPAPSGEHDDGSGELNGE